MTSGYDSAATDALRGERVRVVSNDGQAFVGWVERIQARDRHVLLRGAELVGDASSDDRGTVLVAHADSIEGLEPEQIIDAGLEAVIPSPYHTREFDRKDNELFIDEVRRQGWAESFPTVRLLEDDDGQTWFEIVAGHKRLWAADQAGLASHPVEVVQLPPFEAARRFVHDHLPARRHLEGEGERHDNWYDDEDAEAAIYELIDVLGDYALEIDRVRFNAERLGIDVEAAAEVASA